MIHDHPLFLKGIAEFQTGDFYPCHDSLEALWMDATEPDKTFIQGILQLAVACYHLSNGNERGAMILLGEGINRLQGYRPVYETIDVTTLVYSSSVLLSCIQGMDTPSLSRIVEWMNAAMSPHELRLAEFDDPIRLPKLQRIYENSVP